MVNAINQSKTKKCWRWRLCGVTNGMGQDKRGRVVGVVEPCRTMQQATLSFLLPSKYDILQFKVY